MRAAPGLLALLASAAACYGESGTGPLLWPRADVRLVTDDMGITHVLAQTDEDAFYGAGYAMAHDRLFQMEVYRRQALGTSAEIFGSSQLDADVGARAFDFRALGAQDEALVRAKDPVDARLVDAWVAGVNARVAEVRGGSAPRPYGMGPGELDFVPDPWAPADAFAVGKLLAFGLSNTLDDDILGTAFLRLAPEVASQLPVLQPASDVFTLGQAPASGTALSPRHEGPPPRAIPSDLPPLRWLFFRAGDSNNWAVDAAHSANGHPLLAGDPHQPLTSPTRLWPVHLASEGGSFDVVGFAFPGTPGVELGHNARIGWTATTDFADVMDIWDVTTDAGRTVVHLADGDHPIKARQEVFRIKTPKGYETQAVTLEQVPGYGILLPDRILPLPRSVLADGDAILFNWTGFAPTEEVAAYLGIDRASNVDEFDAAADKLDVGAVNFVAADAEHIDYHVHARVPDRGDPTTHPMPWHILSGTDSASLWTGASLGPDRLPRWRDPARGFLVTANNDPWGFTADGSVEDDPFYYGAYYANGFRAQRIEASLGELLASGQKLTRTDLELLQDDTHSPMSDGLLPQLSDAVGAIGTDPALAAYVGRSDLAALANALVAWNGELDRRRGEPLAFTALEWFAVKRVFYGVLPSALFDAIAAKSPPFFLGMLHNVLATRFPGAQSFLDAAGGTHALLVGALDDSAQWLAGRFGTSDPGGYEWGSFNFAVFSGVYGGLENPPPIAVDGGADTVKVCESAFFDSGGPRASLKANEASVYRMAMEFGDDGVPRATIDFERGTREDPTDPHFGDQEGSWVAGEHRPLAFLPAEIEAHATEVHVLPAVQRPR